MSSDDATGRSLEVDLNCNKRRFGRRQRRQGRYNYTTNRASAGKLVQFDEVICAKPLAFSVDIPAKEKKRKKHEEKHRKLYKLLDSKRKMRAVDYSCSKKSERSMPRPSPSES
jgi:hypothetical protein